MLMKTATKISIARGLHHLVRSGRGIAGWPDRGIFSRRGDGFECHVLRGATAMLREVRPIFVMELAPYLLQERGSSLDEILSHFIPNGYNFYDERTHRRLASTAKELGGMVADGASMNVIVRVT
jgi:hypothetical protein